MSIASRQVTKKVDSIIEKRLKEGSIPSISYLISELQKFYNIVSVGFPSFKGRQQPYRRLWSMGLYNNNLKEIYDDLVNLYEEMVDQFSVVLTNFDYNDIERSRLAHQINTEEGKIDSLLMLADNIEGYIYSIHERFIDRSKMDLQYTTCEVNTGAGLVMLKESRQGIKRLDMSHYYDRDNFPVLAEQSFADTILSNKLYPGSMFGYAFSDINTSWMQRIIRDTEGELEVSFIVELDPSIDDETSISRIEMLGSFPKTVFVEPLWSVDNINFKALPMGAATRKKRVSSDRMQIWNFPETRIQYVKFIVSFREEDEAVGGSSAAQYLYNLGFKLIAFYKVAYIPSSNLYSLPHIVTDPTNESLTVDKVSLVTEQDTPIGSSIKHYVSLGTTGNIPPNFSWTQISPANDPVPSSDQVVDFRHVSYLNSIPDLSWDASSYGIRVTRTNGTDFFKIYTFPFEPLKDTVKLYRGKSNWQVTPRYKIERKNIFNEGHTFPDGNDGIEQIVLTHPSFNPIEGEGLIRGSVKVKSSPGESPDTIYTTPNDYTLSLAGKSITRTRDSGIPWEDELPSTVFVDYQYDDEFNKPTLFTTHIYIVNPDGLDLNIKPFTSAEIEAGQFLTITTSDGEINLSSETFFHVPAGWHKVITTGQPKTTADRFYIPNGNKYLYQLVYKMFAYGEALQQVSWFELRHTTRKKNHLRYAVIDTDGDNKKEILVNYRPQEAVYGSIMDDILNPDNGVETYELSYKYIATQSNTIYYKAILSREESVSADVTPTLYSYTLRIGY